MARRLGVGGFRLYPKAAVRFSRSPELRPKIGTVHEPNPKPDSGAIWLAFALALGTAAAYLLLQPVFGGVDGCGPPGHSTLGRISEATPFVLPLAAAGILLAFGGMRRWRGPTLVWGAITILVISGLLEVFVFLVEFVVHHCGE